jgi:hypothetical protein
LYSLRTSPSAFSLRTALASSALLVPDELALLRTTPLILVLVYDSNQSAALLEARVDVTVPAGDRGGCDEAASRHGGGDRQNRYAPIHRFFLSLSCSHRHPEMSS